MHLTVIEVEIIEGGWEYSKFSLVCKSRPGVGVLVESKETGTACGRQGFSTGWFKRFLFDCF